MFFHFEEHQNFEKSRNLSATATALIVQPNQIRNWEKPSKINCQKHSITVVQINLEREFPIEILQYPLKESRFTRELDISMDIALDMI